MQTQRYLLVHFFFDVVQRYDLYFQPQRLYCLTTQPPGRRTEQLRVNPISLPLILPSFSRKLTAIRHSPSDVIATPPGWFSHDPLATMTMFDEPKGPAKGSVRGSSRGSCARVSATTSATTRSPARAAQADGMERQRRGDLLYRRSLPPHSDFMYILIAPASPLPS